MRTSRLQTNRLRMASRALLAVALFALVGCASTGGTVAGPDDNPDPWEGLNRGIFAFNEGVDSWIIEPVGKLWNYVLPRQIQRGVKNFSDNLWMPAVFANHLLQAHPKEAFAEDLPRLVLNSTFGIAGLFDVASRIGIEENYTDFGVTMGRWGVPSGPYFVIPLLGPSSVRDGVGLVADAFSTPVTYFVPWYGFVVVRATELLNLRSLYLKEIEQSKADAFDYYVFMRDAWTQNRRHYVREARGEPAPDPFEEDDLYYFDEIEEANEGEDPDEPEVDDPREEREPSLEVAHEDGAGVGDDP